MLSRAAAHWSCSRFSIWYFPALLSASMLERMDDPGSAPADTRQGAPGRDRFPRLQTLGRVCFAMATIGFGIEHGVARDFATRVLPPWPLPPPARLVTALLAGALLAACGVAILSRRRQRLAGLCLAVLFAGGLLAVGLPRALAHWRVGAAWTNPCKVMVLVGGALLVAALAREGTTDARHARRHADDLAPRRETWAWVFARFSLALFLSVGGVQHFVYAGFVQTLVPSWIPGALFWTYAAGIGLVAAGIGLAVARSARLAGGVAGATIFTWFLILHVPRAVAAWTDAGEWSGVAESLAIAGIAWLIAGAPPASHSLPDLRHSA